MSFGASDKSEDSTTNQSTTTGPYAPAIPAVNNIISQLSGLSTTPSSTTTDALRQLIDTASKGNPDASGIAGAVSGMINASTQPQIDQANAGYADYLKRLTPTANGDNLDIQNNPQIQKLLQVVSNNVANNVNSSFAASGRTASGANQQALATGITNAQAPILLNQYNTEQARTDQAASNLYGAANTTATTTASLDQLQKQLQAAGINIDPAALAAENWGPTQVAALSQQLQNLPIDQIASIANVLFPAAQLGSQSTGTKNSSTDTTQFGLNGNLANPLAKVISLIPGLG